MLDRHSGDHAVCNGDLLDKFEIDSGELIKVYEMFSQHLETGTLTLIMGNHDASAKGAKVSSFHMLCHFLISRFGNKVRMIDHTNGFCQVENNVWAISHQLNQDLFVLEVEKAAAVDGNGQYLLLHCNVKNTFAEHSDHSLNLTDELLAKLMIAGWTLIVGHEHQGYTLRGGRVVVAGNQFPTTVADCIGETTKHALRITDDGIKYVQTWSAAGNYAEVNWRELPEYAGDAGFIRATGDATSTESADVIATISKFRQKSAAYVVTNAVRIDGAAALDEMSEDAIGEIKAFDVLGAIFEHLDEKQQNTVKGLLA